MNPASLGGVAHERARANADPPKRAPQSRNVANDFGYDPQVARNVSVDTRYLFWILDSLHGDAARAVLKEMGIDRP